MDHSARDRQVSAIAEHFAGDRVRLRFRGQGGIAATVAADKPTAAEALRGAGAKLEIVTIARAALALPLPRPGEHFTDVAGKIFTISEDRSVSFSSTLIYACRTS